MMTTRLKRVLAVAGVFAALVFLNNTSLWVKPPANGPFLVAHRGLAQGFETAGLTGATCTASTMVRRDHDFLENTIPSMAAAFALGADAVELDVHRTTDGRFAVFHDWTVDCRTEGSGRTRDHTLEELQRLDVGYGYTDDDGRSFPFRGTGVGMLPSLEEVLAAFPGRGFVIDFKSNDPLDGELLARRLVELDGLADRELAFVGGGRPVDAVAERLPGVRTMSRKRLKRCLTRYIATGWTGHVPDACHHGFLVVPANVAPWLWGWPHRLMRRMDRVGTRVVLLGDYGGEGFSKGFNDPGRLEDLPRDYRGGIWTDRIDLIAPALERR